jgi:hypothetical protein
LTAKKRGPRVSTIAHLSQRSPEAFNGKNDNRVSGVFRARVADIAGACDSDARKLRLVAEAPPLKRDGGGLPTADGYERQNLDDAIYG